MEQEIKKILDEQSAKIDAMYISVEKLKRYFLITMWVTLLAVVLPIIGIILFTPSMIDSYTNALHVTE